MQLPQISRPTFNCLRLCSQPHQGDFFITATPRRRNLFFSSPTGEDVAFAALAMMRLPAGGSGSLAWGFWKRPTCHSLNCPSGDGHHARPFLPLTVSVSFSCLACYANCVTRPLHVLSIVKLRAAICIRVTSSRRSPQL